MKITPIPALHDNYIWLIESKSGTVCVDPGAASPVLDELRHRNRALDEIWLTHRHADHIGGVEALLHVFPQCRVYGAEVIPGVTDKVGEGGQLSVIVDAAVWHVPGHTQEHLAFLLQDDNGRQHVFCGDTLFSAGCGRIFDGTAEQLQSALERINTLPENTLFYPAHEYTASNLIFAAEVEPDNTAIAAARTAACRLPTLPVTLAHERTVNPFLRFRQAHIRARIAAVRQVDAADDAAVFAALRAWKNEY